MSILKLFLPLLKIQHQCGVSSKLDSPDHHVGDNFNLSILYDKVSVRKVE